MHIIIKLQIHPTMKSRRPGVFLNMLLPPANEVCEGYVFTGVCLSTGGPVWLLPGGAYMVAMGGCAWLLWRGACVVAPGGGMHGCSRGVCMVAPGGGGVWLLRVGGHASDTTRYGDTINERAVRILLECILVINFSKTLYQRLAEDSTYYSSQYSKGKYQISVFCV